MRVPAILLLFLICSVGYILMNLRELRFQGLRESLKTEEGHALALAQFYERRFVEISSVLDVLARKRWKGVLMDSTIPSVQVGFSPQDQPKDADDNSIEPTPTAITQLLNRRPSLEECSLVLDGPETLGVYTIAGESVSFVGKPIPKNEMIETINMIGAAITQRSALASRQPKSLIINILKDRICFAAPISKGQNLRAVVIAIYPKGDLIKWLDRQTNLKPTGSDSVEISIADQSFKVIASSSVGKPIFTLQSDQTKLLSRADGTQGAIQDPRSKRLVGYARVNSSDWFVFTSRSFLSALGSVEKLVSRSSIVVIAVAVYALSATLMSVWLQHRIRRLHLKDPSVLKEVQSEAPKQLDHKRQTDPTGMGSKGLESRPISREPVAKGAWRVISASVAGKSHIKLGKICQDAAYYQIATDDLVIAAVADGAGSALLSDQGAQLAARLSVEMLATHAVAMVQKASDQHWSEILLTAMDVARRNVEASAAFRQCPTQQFASTLLLFVAMRDLVVAAQIGDGAIVIRECDGRVHSLTRPQSGEYLNTTTFLVSRDAMKSAQCYVWRGPYSGVAAFTDGLQMLALNMPSGEPHQAFFKPLFAFADKASDGKVAERDLEAFLRSDKVSNATDDDLTLLIATMAPS